MRDRFRWARLLAFVTRLVNQDLLLRNEYLIAENRILGGHLTMRQRLADPERVTLAEIIPHRHDCICNSSYRRSLSRAARWLAQVLQPRRMNSLAIWESATDFRGT